ncbi:MAG TPA: hypothetical protein VMW50_14900 [Dehalococcoidia bacterium]|nr:hypothetical protein [Dehalococcoidia bacterium]
MPHTSQRIDIARQAQTSPVTTPAYAGTLQEQSRQARADIERQTQEALAQARGATAQYRKLGDLPLHSPAWYSRQATIAKKLRVSAEKKIGVASAEAIKELNVAIKEAEREVVQQVGVTKEQWEEKLARLKREQTAQQAKQKTSKELIEELYRKKAEEVVARYAKIGETVSISTALKAIREHPDWYALPSIITPAPKLQQQYLVGSTGKFYFNPDNPKLGTTDMEFMSEHWSIGKLSDSGRYVWTGTKWASTGTNEANIAAVKGFAGQGVAKYDMGANIKLYYPTKESIGVVALAGGLAKLKTGELVPRVFYDALSKGEQAFLYKYGIDKWQQVNDPLLSYENAVKLFGSKEILALQKGWKEAKPISPSITMPYILSLGKVPKAIYDTQYADAMAKIKLLGVDGYNKWVDANTIKLKSGELIPKDAFDKLTPAQQKELIGCGSVEKFNELHPPLTKGQIAKEIGISQIPVYYTAKSWGTSANWERALNIGIDLLWLIPPARIAAGVARGAVGATRIARIARISKAVAVAEFITPVKALAHPIRAIKFVAEPLETLIRGSKVPIESMSQSYHTIKIPSNLTKGRGVEQLSISAEEAIKARNQIVSQVIMGEPGMFYGKELEALMKPTTLGRIKPCVVAASPDIRPFLKGTTIGPDLFTGPTFYERFAHGTSGGTIVEEGIKGALVITDEKILKALTIGGVHPKQLYLGMAELQAVLKAGYKLPPPSQILFTRSLGGEKLTLLIIGEPFTARELAKLKFIAPVETFKQIFSRPLKLTAKQTNITEKIAIINRRIEVLNTKSYAVEYKGMLKGDVFNKRGNITQTAKGFTHPKGGLVRRRVTGIIVDDKGNILLVNDKVQPRGYFDLPGGQIDPKGKFGRTPGQEGISIEGALHGQVKSEVGFGIKDPVGLPAYRGKINPHSLPGSYVVYANPKSTKINLRRYQPKGKPTEIRKATWWNGKTEIQVSPSTRDILVALNEKGIIKIDVTKLRLHPKVARELYTIRDAKYVNRLKHIDTAKSARVAKEIDILKGTQKELAKEAEEIYRRQAVPMLIDTTDGRYIRLLEKATDIARRAGKVERIPVAPRIARVARLAAVERIARAPRVERAPGEARVPRVPRRVEVPRVSRVARVERVPGVGRVPGIPRIPEIPRIPKIPKIPRIPKVPKVPIIPTEEITGRKGKKLPLGSVTRRQGLFWVTIYPPYRKDNVLYTRYPPRGATIVTGPRSAYKTITKLGFQVPEKILQDMGFMDVIISGKGQKITFKRDIKQKTKLGYAEGMPPGIKMGMLG